MTRKPVSDNEARTFAELYATGWTLKQIGDHLGRPWSTVRWHLQRMGVNTGRGHKWGPRW